MFYNPKLLLSQRNTVNVNRKIMLLQQCYVYRRCKKNVNVYRRYTVRFADTYSTLQCKIFRIVYFLKFG